jgi:transposase
MCRKEDRMHVARIMVNDGHSQKDIAAKLGVSDRMVRKYLKPDFGTRPRKRRNDDFARPCPEGPQANHDQGSPSV